MTSESTQAVVTGPSNAGYSVAETIEEINAMTPEHGAIVSFNGGFFKYDPADDNTPDDGVITLVTKNGSRLKRQFDGDVQASWFGVIADGKTDCRKKLIEAWQYGLSTGRTIKMPVGKVNIGSGFEESREVGTADTGTARILLVAKPEDPGCVIDAYGCVLVPEDRAPKYDSLDPAFVTITPNPELATNGVYPTGTVFSFIVADQTIKYTTKAGDQGTQVVKKLVALFNSKLAPSLWVAAETSVKSEQGDSLPALKYGRTKETNDFPSQGSLTNVTRAANNGWYNEMRHFLFFGSGSGTVEKFKDNDTSEGVFGPTDTNCPFPPFTIKGLEFDYSKQSYQGGTAANPGVNHAKPWGNGARLMDVQYAVYFQLVDCKFKNNYGNGIRLLKCYRPRIQGCLGENISANQVVAPATEAEDADHTGGFIFASSCYGMVVDGTTVRNTRRFEADYTTSKGIQTKGGICGYIGIWNEYPIDHETEWSNGSLAFQKYVPQILFNLHKKNESILSTDHIASGNAIMNCQVEGYTLGIKAENKVEVTLYNVQARDCYIPFQSSNSRMRLHGCTGSFGICDPAAGQMRNPQLGFASITAILSAKDFDPRPEYIEAEQLGYSGASTDKAGLTAHGCTFTAKGGALISAAITGVTIDSCVLVTDGTADILNRVAPNRKCAGLSFTNNTILVTKNSESAGMIIRGQDSARICNNTFLNLNKEKVFAIVFGDNQVSGSGSSVVAIDGRGYFLFSGNRLYGAVSLSSKNTYALVHSRDNTFHAWPKNQAGTYPDTSKLNPLYFSTGVSTSNVRGIVSDGDTILVKADFTAPVINDVGNNTQLRNLTIRFVEYETDEKPLTTGLMTSLIQTWGNGEITLDNVQVIGNDVRKIPLIQGGTTNTKAWGLTFRNVRDDSEDAPLILSGSTVEGPLRLEGVNHYGMGKKLFGSAAKEMNLSANISKQYQPYLGERLTYHTELVPTNPQGAIWNGSTWVTYRFSA
ncbi:hypothetical protein [Mixta gaviniae]|uniref:Uncharacterized protein n=1 Tax=Mixta gaviniae TaxID=665914 RepID=A0A2L0IGG2_9GAMM|nr:hypothetical protein [Mixta gaviniae]AUX93663.1 hypothetical protein C2E15_11610 [Mixta gaviniae]